MSIPAAPAPGHIPIPAEIHLHPRTRPGASPDFVAGANGVPIGQPRSITPTRPEDGYGMFSCEIPGKRRLSDFDVADALRGELLSGCQGHEGDY
jgi:hypothetical protein